MEGASHCIAQKEKFGRDQVKVIRKKQNNDVKLSLKS
jgi:hypothetical protein